MKIKLSKTDWETIGNEMGWIKIAQPEDYEPDMMDSAEPPEELDPSFEEDNSDEESSDFSYLAELEPGDEILKRLRNKAEYLLGMGNTPEDLHKALYWTLHNDNNYLHQPTKGLIPYKPLRGEQMGRMSENIQSLVQALTRALKPQ